MKISVIVPVYNAEPYLNMCIDALLSQTYGAFELILADDGSSDRSGAICDQYAERDVRIRVIHQGHEGQNSARMAALALARGEYIAFADADDWVEPEYLEHLVETLERSDADIVCGGCFCEESGERRKQLNRIAAGVYAGMDQRKRLYAEMLYFGDGFFDFGILPYLWNKLYRRDLLRACYANVDDGIYDGEDVEVVYPYLLRARRIAVTGDCDYHYRIRHDSTSHRKKDDFYENVSRLYLSLNREFDQSEFRELLRPQLDQYMRMMVWSGAKEEYIKLNQYYFPFRKIPCGSDVILYGAGLVGRAYEQQIRLTGYCRLISWVDRNYQALQEKGLPVESPERMQEKRYDYIVIASLSDRTVREVMDDLAGMGVEKERIVKA